MKWWEKYSSGNVTTKKYKSNLGWGRDLYSTTSYYGYGYSTRGGYSYFSGKDNLDEVARIITKAVKATRDMIVILDFPFKIKICLNKEDIAYNVSDKNSRCIFISTSPVDDKDLNDVEKINIICGAGIHEATHLMYTEMRILNKFKNSLENSEYIKDPINKLKFLIANILEDERSEDLLLKNRPGFSGFIDNYKKYNLNVIERLEGTRYSSENLHKILLTSLKFIRFPENVDETVLESNNEFFMEISSIIKDTPIVNTKDCCERSNAIVNAFLSYSTDVLGFKIGTIKGLISSYLNDDIYRSYFIEVFSGQDGENPCITTYPENAMSKYVDGESGQVLSNLVNGIAELGDDKNVYFTKVNGEGDGFSESYLNDKKEISPLIPSIKKIVQRVDKNYKFNIYGCRSGLLDTNKLAEAYQGVPQVYLRQGEVRTNKTTICVLLDESGSMACDMKYYKAKLSAILLNEALGSLPGVDLYIYGHSADISCTGSVDINIYKEGKTFNPKYSLSQVEARCENRDGKAILETAKRVRKFTQEPCLMFIMSDGCPAAYDYFGDEAVKDVKNSVKKVESMGFKVCQVSINKVEGVEEMFNRYTEIFDLSNLPKKLGDLIKESVLEDKKTVIV